MTSPAVGYVLGARVSAGTVIAKGDILIPDASGFYVVATTAVRTALGRRAEAVARVAYSSPTLPGGVEIQETGTLDPSISGLGAGSASWVRCSATGRAERVTTPAASEDVIGWCEPDGRIHLVFGLQATAMVPAGNVDDVVGLDGTGLLKNLGPMAGGSASVGLINTVQTSNGAGAFLGPTRVIAAVDGSGNSFIGVKATASGFGGSLTDFGGVRLASNSSGTNPKNSIYGAHSVDGSPMAMLYTAPHTIPVTNDYIYVGDYSYSIKLAAVNTGYITVSAGEVRIGANESTPPLVVDSTNGISRYGPGGTPSLALSLYNPARTFRFKFITPALAADRDVSLPLLTGADTLVMEAFAATLTNKTINATNNTITDTSAATGDLLMYNGTRFARKAQGSNGQFFGVSGGVAGYYTPSAGFTIGDTQVAFADGANNPAGDAGMTYDKTNDVLTVVGALTLVGGTVHTSSYIRFPYNGAAAKVLIGVKDSGSNNRTLLGFGSGDQYVVGNTSMDGTINAITLTAVATTMQLTCSSVTAGVLSSSKFGVGVPIAGSSADSKPFQMKVASVTLAGATQTLTAAEYECPIVVMGGTPTAGIDVTFPATNGGFWIVFNNTGGTIDCKAGAALTTIGSAKTAIIRADGTNIVRVTADA